MKEITLYIEDDILFDELLKNLGERGINILFNKKDKKYSLVISNEGFNEFLFELSFYLVTQAFFKYTANYGEEIVSKLESKFFNSDYFPYIMLVELMNYFDKNKALKERVFLNFNVRGFKEEIEHLVKDIDATEKLEELADVILTHLKNKKFDLNELKVLKADDMDGVIEFETMGGLKFNESNFSDIFDIQYNSNGDEKDCIAFSWFVCSFLGVEKVIISEKLQTQKYIFELMSLLRELNVELVME